MSQIESGFLDPAGRTPAVYVTADGEGHLFDCGRAEYTGAFVNRLRNLYVSHMHMDHIPDFDAILSLKLHSPNKRLAVYGPAGIAASVRAKLGAYTWNLAKPGDALFDVFEIDGERMTPWAFSVPDNLPGTQGAAAKIADTIWESERYRVRYVALNHGIASLGYCFEEKDTFSVSKEALAASGQAPGAWLQEIKAKALRGEPVPPGLLIPKKGKKIAYLTDFVMEAGTIEKIAAVVRGADTLYCESNYADAEIELAKKNYHLTAGQAADIALACEAGRLVLFHFSARYEDREPLFRDARARFSRVE